MEDPVVISSNNKTPHVIFILILMAAGYSIWQFYQLPGSVRSSFENLYPHIVEYHWEKNSENYEFDFSADSIKTEAIFDAAGHLVELITEVHQDDVPGTIIDEFNSLYPDYSIGETEEIQMGDSILFDLRAHNGSKGLEVVFGADGQLIKQERFHWDTKWEPEVR